MLQWSLGPAFISQESQNVWWLYPEHSAALLLHQKEVCCLEGLSGAADVGGSATQANGLAKSMGNLAMVVLILDRHGVQSLLCRQNPFSVYALRQHSFQVVHGTC